MIQPNPTPKIIFSTLLVDYGKVDYNSYPFRTLTIRNIGDAPLILKNIKVSGGGLMPVRYRRTPILPDEHTEIQLRYNTRRLGRFQKNLTIISNAGRQVIRVKGYVLDTIQPKIEADSNVLDFGTILQNSNPYRVFKFKNIGKRHLVIKHAKCSGFCVASAPKFPIPPNGTGEIKIKYDTKRLGRINKSIRLETNNQLQPYYIIQIKGEVVLPK